MQSQYSCQPKLTDMPSFTPLDASRPRSRYTRKVTQQKRPSSRPGVYHAGYAFREGWFCAREMKDSPDLSSGEVVDASLIISPWQVNPVCVAYQLSTAEQPKAGISILHARLIARGQIASTDCCSCFRLSSSSTRRVTLLSSPLPLIARASIHSEHLIALQHSAGGDMMLILDR